MNDYKSIKISTGTYTLLNFLKGWMSMSERRNVTLDDAIVASVEAMKKQNNSLTQAIELAEDGVREYA